MLLYSRKSKQLAFICGTALLVLATLAGTAAQGREVSNAEAVKGVWILAGNSGTAIDSVEDLERLRPNLDEALAIEGVRGFSMRVTWRSIDQNFELLDYGKRLADEKGLDFTFRILAGYRVPSRIFEAGSPWHFSEESGERRIPTPFHPDGSPNTVFEKHYREMLERATGWARENGIRIVLVPWYGMSWAEIDHHVSARSAEGYTFDRWHDAQLRILDIALEFADDRLAVCIPFSGGGPTGDVVASMADYVWEKLGPNDERFFFSANGWADEGYWGSPDPEMEQFKREAFERPVLRSLQSIRQGEYDWKRLFALLREVDATFCEIYAETLNFAGVDVMKEEIARFAQHVRENPAPRPPDAESKPARKAIASGPTEIATFGWDELDSSMRAAEQALQRAHEARRPMTLRVIGGRATPERIYAAGARAFQGEDAAVPVPSGTDGKVDPILAREFEKFVAHLAGWCRGNGVRHLEVSWFGDINEPLYAVDEIDLIEGVSDAAWLRADAALTSLAVRQAGRGLAVSPAFPGFAPGTGGD